MVFYDKKQREIIYKENRIDEAMNINRVWLIPKTAKKPADGRYRINKEQTIGEKNISHVNKLSRHIEHSQLTEAPLNDRAFRGASIF